jgi:hypothetical protein
MIVLLIIIVYIVLNVKFNLHIDAKSRFELKVAKGDVEKGLELLDKLDKWL